jgi:lipopolysaccharide transport system ATP-binding protein
MGNLPGEGPDKSEKGRAFCAFESVLFRYGLCFILFSGRWTFVIDVKNLSKTFKLYSSPAKKLEEIFTRKKCHTLHHALSNLTFRVEDGESLGIIGPNGAGKSTLLKILNGVIMQDSGSFRVSGNVTGLLELGTGFNPEMTGLENIYMNGLLIGMDREYLKKKVDEIIDFSELGNFINEPLKIYSSGMVMRLAFSIAINAEPSCFLIDEALSVGDAHFQQKCMKRIRKFRERGGSIIFVSHDINAVKVLCDKAILLHHGKALEYGDPEKVINSYNFILAKMNDNNDQIKVSSGETGEVSYGSREVFIEKATIKGMDSGSDILTSGETALLDIYIRAENDISELTVGFGIRDRYGQDIFGTNTYHHGISISCRSGVKYLCRWEIPLNIAPGKYTIIAALHTQDTHVENCYHWDDHICDFEVAGYRGASFIGIARLEPQVLFQERNEG